MIDLVLSFMIVRIANVFYIYAFVINIVIIMMKWVYT